MTKYLLKKFLIKRSVLKSSISRGTIFQSIERVGLQKWQNTPKPWNMGWKGNVQSFKHLMFLDDSPNLST